MTVRQERIIEVIRAYVGANGISPTYQEIADRMRVSTSTVHFHVEALAKQGVLKHERARSRSIVLLMSETCTACGQPRRGAA